MHPSHCVAICSHSHFDRATVRSCVLQQQRTLNFQNGENILEVLLLWIYRGHSYNAILSVYPTYGLSLCQRDFANAVRIYVHRRSSLMIGKNATSASLTLLLVPRFQVSPLALAVQLTPLTEMVDGSNSLHSE